MIRRSPMTKAPPLPRLLFAAALLASGLAASAAPAGTGRAQVTLNLKDADIATLIATVSEVTGKNFIIDPRVKGKVTVVSASPMDAAGVYETFLAVLQVNGFATVPAGEAIKIVPEVSARQDGGTYVSNGSGMALDEIVTHVYEVQHASAAQIVAILRPLVAQSGQLAAYAPGNMLIISDRASNVVRMEKLIAQIDSSGDRDIEMIALENASAGEVVKTVSALQQQDKQVDPTARPATVIADERSNSVLVGGDKSDREKIRAVIARLDQPMREDSYTQVVFLKYAIAETLAPILQGYAQSSTRADSSKSILGSSSGTGSSGLGSGGSSGASALGGGALNAAASAPSGGGSSGGASQLYERTTIVPDRDTNALVISAPPKTMKLLRDVIRQLDVQRSQVLVEAIIAEVSANRSSDLGVDWIAYNPNSLAAAGILNAGTSSALQNAASALGSTSSSSISSSQIAGAAASLLGTGVTAAAGTVTAGGAIYAALLKALRSDGDSNILSTPSTMVLDNQEAKFSAVQNVPFLTGQYSNSGVTSTSGVVNPFQTYDRQDVGLKLGVVPTISSGNSIQLRIEIENSNVASGNAGANNLVTTKRTFSTAVSVENGQILVLGGLTDDQLSDSKTRIPVLSDIPLLGSLFQSRSISKIRRNLMVFIHPSIIRAREDSDYYTRMKYDDARNAQLDTAKGAVPMVGGQRPLLYDYDDYLRRNNRPTAQPAPSAPPGAAVPATPAAAAPAAPRAVPVTPAPSATQNKSPLTVLPPAPAPRPQTKQ